MKKNKMLLLALGALTSLVGLSACGGGSATSKAD
jgi:ABC-type glycerol-3-phosphate transport system substrate-binding protein